MRSSSTCSSRTRALGGALCALSTLFATAFTPASAFADEDKAACVDASLQGQALRNAHKLVEARERLRACAAAACPSVVQSDCATWLAEVESALPTVVVTAKDGAGADLAAVTVTVDGQPFLSSLDGQAVPMNAGSHTFHFALANGTSLDRPVIIREGEKNQSVSVVLGAPPAPAPPSPPPPVAPPPPPARVDRGVAAGSEASPWRTVGWILGGVGVAGLGVGAAFGLVAIGSKSSDCNSATDKCLAGTLSGIKTDAVLSDVGWIAGGVLLATGAALVLWAPRGSHEGAAGVSVAPVVMAGGGAIVGGGSF